MTQPLHAASSWNGVLDTCRSGVLQDGSRVSLRLAVSSLARHHAFDDLGETTKGGEVALQLRPEDQEESRWTKPGEDQKCEINFEEDES